ncbi:MAG TPA: MBL fold metallo-hydrolase [Ktedonobacteraceae bacterium]|nr:MBL fold metallo-hydrolase [Ktedonobacteraceae bacterium]
MDTAIEGKRPEQPVERQPRQVHTITDRFSMANTYLINDERMIVVDPGSVLNTQLLLSYLQRFLQRKPEDIDLIVLTHLHPDHSAGVDALRKVTHAPAAAYSGTPRLLDPLATSDEYERQAQMIDIWLEDVVGLPNHLDWRVIASPGHTAESLCLYNPFSYELLCGDTLITLDGGTILARGGTNRRRLQQTIQTLESLKVYYLYPGHGRPILSMRALANVEW